MFLCKIETQGEDSPCWFKCPHNNNFWNEKKNNPTKSGGLVVVHGGPGVGKTELAAHVRAWAMEHDLTVLSGRTDLDGKGLVFRASWISEKKVLYFLLGVCAPFRFLWWNKSHADIPFTFNYMHIKQNYAGFIATPTQITFEKVVL